MLHTLKLHLFYGHLSTTKSKYLPLKWKQKRRQIVSSGIRGRLGYNEDTGLFAPLQQQRKVQSSRMDVSLVTFFVPTTIIADRSDKRNNN